MKITKSQLRQIIKEEIHNTINGKELNEFFGLFGGGKKKKKAAAPAPKAEPAAEPAADSGGEFVPNESEQEKIDSVNAVIRKHYGSYAKDYFGPCSAPEGQFGHVPGLEAGKRTFITDKRYDKLKSSVPYEWTKEQIDKWQKQKCD